MPTLPDIERRTRASRIILTVSLISAVACFIPILGLISTESSLVVNDDHPYLNSTCQSLQAATTCLVISIVPMCDLFLEWISSFTIFDGLFSVFGIEERKKRVQAAAFLDASSVRMNLLERTLFVLGIVCLGGNQSFPSLYLSPLHSGLGIGFSGVSGVFKRMSIISFICRISPTWTPLRSVSLATVLGIFHVLFVSTLLFPALKSLKIIVLFLFLGILFVALCLVIMALYDMFIRQSTVRINGEENGTMNPDIISNTPMGPSANDLSEQRLHNVVITIHMFAAFFPAVLQMIWDFFGSHWTAGTVPPQYPSLSKQDELVYDSVVTLVAKVLNMVLRQTQFAS